MPEDLKTVISRILSHIEQHLNIAKKANELDEYDTLDFALSIIAQDAVRARAAVSQQVRFLKQQQ